MISYDMLHYLFLNFGFLVLVTRTVTATVTITGYRLQVTGFTVFPLHVGQYSAHAHFRKPGKSGSTTALNIFLDPM